MLTVNVVQIVNDQVTIQAFPDKPQGNREAQARFTQVVREHEDISDEDMETLMDDGEYHVKPAGSFRGFHRILLVHSE